MAQKIEIASLDLDVKSMIQKMYETADSIKYMKEQQALLLQEQKKYNMDSEEGRKKIEQIGLQFQKNSVQLKQLGNEYSSLSKAVQAQVKANGELITKEQAVDLALKAEITSIASAIESNKELRTVRNQLNLTTDEGRKALQAINDKIDENTAFVKANGSAFEVQKMNIGDYKNQVGEAFQELNIFNGGMTGFIMRSKEAGGVGPLLSASFSAMTTGIVGMTKAGIAFIATPLGAALAAIAVVVALVVGAFKFMTASMNSTEQGSQKLAKITATISGLFNGFFKILKPFGEWLGGAFIAYIEMVGEALNFMVDSLAAAAEFVGMDDTAASIRQMKNEVIASAEAAGKLAEAEGDLDEMMRNARKTQLDYQKQAEKLRQQRDDESNSIAKRIDLNNQLSVVLKNQMDDELAIANQQLKVANLRIKSEGKTKEALDERAEALANIADIEERITGQQSEQMANLNSLRKEANDAAVKAREDAEKKATEALQKQAEKQQLLLDEYLSQQGIKAKSLDDELKQAEYVAEQKRKIALAEFNATKKTENDRLKLNIKNNEISKELMKARADAAISNAETVLKQELTGNAEILNNQSFLNDELFAAKTKALNDNADAEKEAFRVRLENGAINEQMYIDELNRINDENRKNQETLRNEREQAERDKKAIDLENERIAQGESFNIDLAAQIERLEFQRAEERKIAEAKGADLVAFDKATAKMREDIERTVMNNKLALASTTFANIATIVGKESAVGKAAAVAQTTIDTYKSATSAYAGMVNAIPGPVGIAAGAIAAAASVVMGLANVKKIVSTKTPKAEKGGLFTIGGKRHSAGGTMFTGADGTQFEAEQGELIGVMSRPAARHFMAFNNAFTPGSGASPSNYFASGGIVSREISSPGIDIDVLANRIAEANKDMPAPVVAVRDIITEGNNYVRVSADANF